MKGTILRGTSAGEQFFDSIPCPTFKNHFMVLINHRGKFTYVRETVFNLSFVKML